MGSYVFTSLSRFHPSLTWLKNGWDDTELQVGLVLSDAASTSEA